MAKIADCFVGSVHGRWTILSLDRRNYRVYANCRCECGTVKEVEISTLGRSQSCGCLHSEIMRKVKHKHGKAGSKTYKIWVAMWGRCTLPSQYGHHNYKFRTPPERWKSFENFLADMGECPEGYSIERKDNDKPYGPDNCVWIPFPDQGANKSTNYYIELDGERMHLAEAKRRLGVPNSSFYAVRARGGSVAEALKVEHSRILDIGVKNG